MKTSRSNKQKVDSKDPEITFEGRNRSKELNIGRKCF